MATAVLDVGKTNVKLAVFEGARVVWQRSAPNAPLPGPPYPHCDVEGIFAFFLAALREAAQSHVIDTVTVTTHGATAALIDDDGLALPVMDYEFDGVDTIEPLYATDRPPFAETFSPPLPVGLNLGRQLRWQEEHHPDAFARARHLLMYPQYFVWRLTGVAANEVTSLGCHGDLWQPDHGRPSSLIERRGWSRLLPALVKAYASVGPLLPAMVKATGLPATTRVLAGAHDSNASLLPHLLTLPRPFTVVSTGTWVVIMAVGADTARLDPARDMYANVDVTGTAYPCAKFMGGREVATILDGTPPACDLDDLAAVLASDALALPAFVANGGPFQGRAGAITGTLPDRPGARAALASLYAALVTDAQLAALGADRGPLAIEGSFAANAVYAGVLAALRPTQPVLLSPDTAGTAYGASLLAHWPQAPDRSALPRAQAVTAPDALFAHRVRWQAAIG